MRQLKSILGFVPILGLVFVLLNALPENIEKELNELPAYWQWYQLATLVLGLGIDVYLVATHVH